MKNWLYSLLRSSEPYTKTDMVYFTQNTFWVNANTVIVTFLSFGLSLLFARFVSKEVFGTYQFLLSISSVLSALTLTGMNVAVGQAVSRGFEGVFRKSVSIQVKMALLPFVASLITALYYLKQGNHTLSIAIVAIGIFMPLANALNTWGSYMTGKKLFKPIFFCNQILNLFYYGTIIIPIFWFPKAMPLILANIIFGALANAIIYFHVNKEYPPNKEDDPEAISYGKRLSLSNILPMAIYQIDNIIVFHLLGATNLAIYSFASNIPDRFISMLRAIPAVAFPKFSEKSKEEISRILPKRLLQFSIISIIAGVIYFFLAPFVYNTFFPQYSESLIYSQVYILVAILSAVVSLSTTALFATRSSKIFITNIINPVVSIIIVILGGYMYGIWGVICGRILSNLFNLGSNVYFTRNHS